MPNRLSRVNLIIHLFAMAHAIAALSMSLLEYGDGLVLTILTIIMIFGLANVYKLPVDVTAILALLSCCAGYFLGTKCAYLFRMLWGQTDGWNILATVLVTEILGWAIYFVARGARFSKRK